MYNELIEDLVASSDNVIFVVLYYEYNFSKLLKAFQRKIDAEAYQRYYSLVNFKRCYIEEVILE